VQARVNRSTWMQLAAMMEGENASVSSMGERFSLIPA
jgi:hypothetical protein